jgi:hypothetical protein
MMILLILSLLLALLIGLIGLIGLLLIVEEQSPLVERVPLRWREKH